MTSAPWSPNCSAGVGARSKISRRLRLHLPVDPSRRWCHRSIYQAVYQPNPCFLRSSRLAPRRRSPLRTVRDHRRAHQCQQRWRPPFQIHDRPFPPNGQPRTRRRFRENYNRQRVPCPDRSATTCPSGRVGAGALSASNRENPWIKTSSLSISTNWVFPKPSSWCQS